MEDKVGFIKIEEIKLINNGELMYFDIEDKDTFSFYPQNKRKYDIVISTLDGKTDLKSPGVIKVLMTLEN